MRNAVISVRIPQGYSSIYQLSGIQGIIDIHQRIFFRFIDIRQFYPWFCGYPDGLLRYFVHALTGHGSLNQCDYSFYLWSVPRDVS